MRVTTDFFATALLRQIRVAGGFAYLVRRGAQEAGALFIVHYQKEGHLDLYGPAPQSLYHSPYESDERLFIHLIEAGDNETLRLRLEKELDFDPDIWLIEIENLDRNLAQMIKVIDETIS